MDGYYVKKVGQNKGAPRVWLDGTATERAGFQTGQRYDVTVEGNTVVLQANPDGSRIVSGKVIGEKSNPIIDLNSKALLAIFDGMAAIRVVVKKDQIYLLPLASELKKKERFDRLRQKLENGDPIAIGSLSHGGGILSHAVHSGLAASGIKSELAFANEIREELLEHASIHNDAWNERTQILSAPMQELAFDDRGIASIPKVEILEMGLPCSGASRAGKSKRGLVHAEAHPDVGHLIVSALMIVSKTNPAIVLMENVPEYSQTASADILRNQFRDLGYNTQERILNGKEWGALENRNRWCMVAVTHGLEFDFNQLQPSGKSLQLVADVLDPTIGPDDDRYRSYEYLKSKEVRDAVKGSSFSMQIVQPGADSVPTLRKGYAKGGSTDPLLAHPKNLGLMRQFTAEEHARIKQIPVKLVDGLASSIAHQVLGQSIVYAPFKDIGAHIGNTLNILAGKEIVPINPDAVLNYVVEDIAPAELKNVESDIGQLDLLGGDIEVVSKGSFVGSVVSIENDLVTQKINRAGATVVHAAKALSRTVVIGELLSVNYKAGRGQIKEKSILVER